MNNVVLLARAGVAIRLATGKADEAVRNATIDAMIEEGYPIAVCYAKLLAILETYLPCERNILWHGVQYYCEEVMSERREHCPNCAYYGVILRETAIVRQSMIRDIWDMGETRAERRKRRQIKRLEKLLADIAAMLR